MKRVASYLTACLILHSAHASPPLPAESTAMAAIASDPHLQRAAEELSAADVVAQRITAGEHEWSLSGGWQERDIAHDRSYGEWEASLQRGWRLPGKSSADRRIAAGERDRAQNAFEDAWHQAAVEMLDAWFAWLRAAAEHELSVAAGENAQRELAVTRRRHESADAAQMDVDLAEANAAGVRAQRRRAQRDLDIARQSLQLRYRNVEWPQEPPPVDEPDLVAGTREEWVDRVVVRSHEIEMKHADQQRAEAQAQRAGLDVVADPVIGLRVLNELGGNEKALGITFTQAFGGTARRAEASARKALARSAAAQTRAVTLEVSVHAATLFEYVIADEATWRMQHDALTAADSHYRRAARAHELGELGLPELLVFSRLRLEAAHAEAMARLDAHYSRYRLEVDAHERWALEERH